jgi:hypothetical protein
MEDLGIERRNVIKFQISILFVWTVDIYPILIISFYYLMGTIKSTSKHDFAHIFFIVVIIYKASILHNRYFLFRSLVDSLYKYP